MTHKGITPSIKTVLMSDKEAIAFSHGKTVPILVDGDAVVRDSMKIVCYLEETYPDRPSLFGGAVGRSLAQFFQNWVDRTLLPVLLPMILADVYLHAVHPDDQAYFREKMERVVGGRLEAVQANSVQDVVIFRELLDPIRGQLKLQPFVSGEQPAYADHILFSLFQWARVSSAFPLLKINDPVADWRSRMLDQYDGLARSVVAFDTA